MDKIKILVACHKPWKVYQNDVYAPIHVGRAVSECKDEMADMIGDDTGDNISEKNPQYCELTALYWAWKNLHDVEYIGFCHYRRYFDINIGGLNCESLLYDKDVLALRYTYYHSMYWEMLRYVSLEDFTILLMVLKKKYPDYEKTMIDYLYGNVLYPKNMFICRREIFVQYAEWLFDVLFECEKYIKPSPYSRGKRSLAYMGEYLMPVYMNYHKMKISFIQEKKEYVSTIRISLGLYRRYLLSKYLFKLKSLIEKKPKTLEYYYDPAAITGLEKDGIKIG